MILVVTDDADQAAAGRVTPVASAAAGTRRTAGAPP
jgi:hypothetical protein